MRQCPASVGKKYLEGIAHAQLSPAAHPLVGPHAFAQEFCGGGGSRACEPVFRNSDTSGTVMKRT